MQTNSSRKIAPYQAFSFVLLFLSVCLSTTLVNAQRYVISTIAGNGIAGYSGDGGPATSAQFNNPTGVAIDDSGNIYVADQYNNHIRKINTLGIVTSIAGSSKGFSGDGGSATLAKLNRPFGIMVDDTGNMYIADQNNWRIRKVNRFGIINTIAGGGSIGIGDGGPATAAQLLAPSGCVMDKNGNLYIVDQGDSRIREVDPSGTINTIAGNGSTGFGGDGGPATSAALANPVGIALDSLDDVYISDNNRIREISTGGIINSIAGGGSSTPGNGGPATAAQLGYPSGIAIDSIGDIYFTEMGINGVRIVNTSGIINTLAGTGLAGYSGDGGPADSAMLSNPTGICIDKAGNIYIADCNNQRIRKLCLSTATPGLINGDTIVCPGSTQTYAIAPIPGALSYNWELPTGWSGSSTTDSITVTIGTSGGVIVVSANNACGKSSANSLKVNILSPPSQPGTISGNTVICLGSIQKYSIASVSGASSYSWVLPAGWSGSSTDTDIVVVTSTGAGSIQVAANDCGGSSLPQQLSIHLLNLSPPSICYVTVDTSSTYNDILWDKSGLDTLAIDSFRIYKKLTSKFYLIGNVSVHAPCSYIDLGSSPNSVSSFYEISSIDTCGNESLDTMFHETMLMTAAVGLGNVVNLAWNTYIGANVNYYRILRDDSGKGEWHKIDSVPSGVNVYVDNSPPASPNLRYLLNTIWNLTCTPSLEAIKHPSSDKSLDQFDALNYSFTSYSNRKDIAITGVDELSNLHKINIYPNPANGLFTFQTSGINNKSVVEIYNTLGEKIYTGKLNSTTTQIDISNNASGIYLYRVITETGDLVSEGKFVKE